MKPPFIVAIGEILWDLLPTGPMLGGAPANFAYHAHALGAEVRLVTRIAQDPLGQEIVRRFEALKMSMEAVQFDEERPTGTVGVTLEAGQPRYTIHDQVAWDQLRSSTVARQLVARADAVCFGSLAQRSVTTRAAIRSLLVQAPDPALRIFDINLRAPFFSRELVEESLAMTNVLKLNDDELSILAVWFGLHGSDRELLAGLASRFDLRVVALTRGSRGSMVLAGREFSEHPGFPVEVRDTIGAGDAFTAALTLGLLCGWPLDRINEHAAKVAAFVCTQSGGMPRLAGELRLYPF